MNDLFNKEFKTKLFKALKTRFFRIGRMFLVLILVFSFVYFGVTPTDSMYPTVQVGDLILFSKSTSNLRHGNIISFVSPLDNKTVYLKRIIGIAGDEVEVKNGIVYVNGQQLNEDYINESPFYDYPKTKVAESSYFVLGDNRNNSFDSSNWGFVKQELVKGKVVGIVLPIRRLRFFKTR